MTMTMYQAEGQICIQENDTLQNSRCVIVFISCAHWQCQNSYRIINKETRKKGTALSLQYI